jgi:hypothetical protein
MAAKLRNFVFVMALAVPAACSSAAREADTGATPVSARTIVQVQNRNFYDMQIYTVRFGERQRLGLATGNQTTTFELPRNWIDTGGTVQFVASPVGSNQVSWSQQLSVQPGDVVRLQVN